MIALRRESIALREGAFVALDAPEPLLMFERRHADQTVRCCFNLGAAPAALPTLGPAKRTLLSQGAASKDMLGPFGALIFEV